MCSLLMFIIVVINTIVTNIIISNTILIDVSTSYVTITHVIRTQPRELLQKT